jgi:hypothetical protein
MDINEHIQNLKILLRKAESYPVKTNEEVELRKFIADCEQLQISAKSVFQPYNEFVESYDDRVEAFLQLYQSLPMNLFPELTVMYINRQYDYALKFNDEVIIFLLIFQLYILIIYF